MLVCWLFLQSKRHSPRRPPVAKGRRLPSRMALSLSELEMAAFGALEKEAHLDEMLGAGVGAGKERAVIQAAVAAYEEALAANEAAVLAREAAKAAEAAPPKRTLYHAGTDHIAIFGGDPARRKDKVSKLMHPYASLSLYGTPRDVGTGDQQRLVSQIRNGKLDVVYCWTRLVNPTPACTPVTVAPTHQQSRFPTNPDQVQQPRLSARHTPGLHGHAGGRVRGGGVSVGDEQLLVRLQGGLGRRRRGMTSDGVDKLGFQ